LKEAQYHSTRATATYLIWRSLTTLTHTLLPPIILLEFSNYIVLPVIEYGWSGHFQALLEIFVKNSGFLILPVHIQ
jgi:hypothetical protein